MHIRPALSIVTVTRNACEDLKKTSESLMDQTFQDWEWVVIDGASTDDTLPFLKTLDSSKVSFKSEPDTGIYNAMNKGLQEIHGTYVYFLNAGDSLASHDALEKVFKQISGIGVFYSNIVLEASDSLSLRIYPSKITTEYWLYNYLCHQAVIFHSDIFKTLGPMDEQFRFAADFEYFMKIRKSKKYKFKHVNETLSVYDLNGVSASPKNRAVVLGEFHTIIQKYFGFFTRCSLLSPREVPEIKKYKVLAGIYLGLKILRRMKLFFRKIGYEPVDLYFLKSESSSGKVKRVLHLSSYVDSGGASVAAMRLHRALPAQGIETAVVVSHRDSHMPIATALAHKSGFRYKIFRFYEFIQKCLIFLGRMPPKGHLSINWNTFCELSQLERILSAYRPDVVHLHWLGHGFLRIEDFAKIKVPIAWTFHDMWPFLSLNHLVEDPQSREPITAAEQKKRGLWNIDRWVWNRKKAAYAQMAGRIQGVCPSSWMKEISDRSDLMGEIPRTVIANTVNKSDFYPMDKRSARKTLGFSEDATVLLFGAFGPFIEENKGYDDFVDLVKRFHKDNPKKEIVVMTFGSGLGYRAIPDINHRHFEAVRSNEFLRLIFSAATLTVVASRVESFCLVAAESMACGTPVVSYDTSGLKDVIDHQVNGYRAECFSTDSLYAGLNWTLSSSEHLREIAELGVQKIERISSNEIVGGSHRKLYENLVR